MLRLRRSAVVFMVLAGAAPGLLGGCGCFGLCKRRKVAEPAPIQAAADSDYEKLAAKAQQGDVKAARKLAEWCYVHDADNERAKHWLEVAARNGDRTAAKVADRVADWQ